MKWWGLNSNQDEDEDLLQGRPSPEEAVGIGGI